MVSSPPLLASAPTAPEHAADTGLELGHVERLGQVVVRTLLQAVDLVVQRVLGRDDDYVLPPVQLLYMIQQPETVPSRQHDVQQYAVIGVPGNPGVGLYPAILASASVKSEAVSTTYFSSVNALCINSLSDGSSSTIRSFI